MSSCVCVSVISLYVCRVCNCIEVAARIGLFFANGLPSTSATLCFKEIGVSPKIRVFPFVTSSQTLDLENMATAPNHRQVWYKQRQWSVCCWQHMAATADVASLQSLSAYQIIRKYMLKATVWNYLTNMYLYNSFNEKLLLYFAF